MRKITAYIGIAAGLIGCMGFTFLVRQQHSSEKLFHDTPLWIEENLPFGIERNNPVPEVKHWNFQKRSYYYFNWGLKKTGGYRLEVIDVKNQLIKINQAANVIKIMFNIIRSGNVTQDLLFLLC